jgi:hypothetical protein
MFRRHNPCIGVAVLVAATISLVLIAGCASPGQPHPPSLNLPAVADKLSGERIGDQVTLRWTTARVTTDGPAIKGPVTAVVCLDGAPTGAGLQVPAKKKAKKASLPPDYASHEPGYVCNAVKRAPVASGPSHVTVPVAQASGPATLMAYRIELENAQARSAGPSQPVLVAGGAAPPAVAGLTLTARRGGALLQWRREAGSAIVEVTRTLQEMGNGPTQLVEKAKSPTSPKAPPREVVLRADGADAGGMIDGSVVDGSSYRYSAERVQTVTIDGHELQVRSAPSELANFTYHDVFPPKAPTGLVLVPGGGFGEAPSIDLSWDANFDSDMLGYNVYRSEGTGAFTKVNAEPVPVPAFRDLHVEPGQRYTYRVTAVDQRKNESEPGGVASEALRK